MAKEEPQKVPKGPHEVEFATRASSALNSTSRRSQEGLREAPDGPRGAQERANRAPRGSRISTQGQ